MTKKDYELIANAIRTLPSSAIGKNAVRKAFLKEIAQHIGEALQGTNHAFDLNRFVSACMAEPKASKKVVLWQR